MKDREIGSLLFLTDKSYARIKGHLQRKQREKEAMEEEKAYKKYLKQRSDEMAKKWPDSVQVRKLLLFSMISIAITWTENFWT